MEIVDQNEDIQTLEKKLGTHIPSLTPRRPDHRALHLGPQDRIHCPIEAH